MAYRDVAPPVFLQQPHTTGDWLNWLAHEGVLFPVAPRSTASCARCFGATGYQNTTGTWPVCVQCQRYGETVDAYVPITYSLDAGLESVLHRFKDFEGHQWLRLPLASLLHEFLVQHSACINSLAPGGRVDIATIVPPNDTRAFNHLEHIFKGVIDEEPVLNLWNWDTTFVQRDPSVAKPSRGRLTTASYTVAPFNVEGSAVLLLDDTWTSGASACSTAGALKAAGAAHVTVLTLGRQLNLQSAYGSTQAIYDDVAGRPWDVQECVLCA